MSNSIWKTPDIKPDPADEIVFMIGDLPTVGWYFATDDEFLDPSTNNRYAPDEIDRWAIFADLIAQADKAERLQKAVDNSREKLAAFMHDTWGNWFAYQLNNSTVENLQRWGIQSSTAYSSLTETDKDKDRKFADKIIEIIKDEIKQLIRGE